MTTASKKTSVSAASSFSPSLQCNSNCKCLGNLGCLVTARAVLAPPALLAPPEAETASPVIVLSAPVAQAMSEAVALKFRLNCNSSQIANRNLAMEGGITCFAMRCFASPSLLFRLFRAKTCLSVSSCFKNNSVPFVNPATSAAFVGAETETAAAAAVEAVSGCCNSRSNRTAST